MQRILPSLLFALLFSSALSAQMYDYYPPSKLPDRIMLNLTSDPTRSMAVTWRTSTQIDSGVVQYTEADPSPDLEDKATTLPAVTTFYKSDASEANYHSTVMEDLKPGRMYAYRVGHGHFWSEWAHFRTPDKGKTNMSFIYFGDAQNDLKSMWSRAIRGAFQEAPKADFLLHAGDLVNRRNRDHEWGEWYYAGGWIYSMIPSIATPGNHEYGKDENDNYVLSSHWKPTFTLPENGPKGYDETAYFIDYQDVRIISFDAPAFYRSAADSIAQVLWLDSLLAETDAKWKIVTMHYPIYSTKFGRDNTELRTAVQPILQRYGVDIVLTGHDHGYGRGTNIPIGVREKNSLDGPIYVVSVSGPKMYDIGFGAWMQRGASNTQLFQILNVTDDVLKFEAYTVDNQLYDAFEIHKDKKGGKKFIDQTPKTRERLELPQRYFDNLTEEEIFDYKTRLQRYKDRVRY